MPPAARPLRSSRPSAALIALSSICLIFSLRAEELSPPLKAKNNAGEKGFVCQYHLT
jgi:hypothetical protein